MNDAKDLLERARRQAPEPETTFDRLTQRRDRRRRTARIEAAIVGLLMAVVAGASVFVAFRGHEAGRIPIRPAVASSTNLPPASQPPLVAGPGQYYYEHVSIEYTYGSSDAQGNLSFTPASKDCELWWRPDRAGRIYCTSNGDPSPENAAPLDHVYGPGEFSELTDTTGFPTDTDALVAFLLERSAPDGSSPAPLVTPPPEGAPRDGQLWRAITDLMQSGGVTPTLRAALLDVAAGLQGATVTTDAVDPVGRPAIMIELVDGDGDGRLYVDPSTHELLAFATVDPSNARSYNTWTVEQTGVVDSTSETPPASAIPAPAHDLRPNHLGG